VQSPTAGWSAGRGRAYAPLHHTKIAHQIHSSRSWETLRTLVRTVWLGEGVDRFTCLNIHGKALGQGAGSRGWVRLLMIPFNPPFNFTRLCYNLCAVGVGGVRPSPQYSVLVFVMLPAAGLYKFEPILPIA
jgi:hypothetical protein